MNWDWSASQRCVTDMNWELECQSPSRHLKTLATGVPANSWSLQVPVWHCVHHGSHIRTSYIVLVHRTPIVHRTSNSFHIARRRALGIPTAVCTIDSVRCCEAQRRYSTAA